MMLQGCAWQGGSLTLGQPVANRPGQVAPLGQPARVGVVDGQLIEEPLTPIETVIEGMGQAQKVRELTRKLSR
jgi:hypothetical protein